MAFCVLIFYSFVIREVTVILMQFFYNYNNLILFYHKTEANPGRPLVSVHGKHSHPTLKRNPTPGDGFSARKDDTSRA